MQNKNDTIYRQAAIDALAKEMPSLTTPDGSGEFDHDIQIIDEAFVDCMQIVNELPPAQPEYTGNEESILTMLFGIARLIIDSQGGYMEMTDGRYFDSNDLFGLAEKLGINY